MYMPEKIFVKVLAKQINFWQDYKMAKLQKTVESFCKALAQGTSQYSPSVVFAQLILKMQVHKSLGQNVCISFSHNYQSASNMYFHKEIAEQ